MNLNQILNPFIYAYLQILTTHHEMRLLLIILDDILMYIILRKEW